MNSTYLVKLMCYSVAISGILPIPGWAKPTPSKKLSESYSQIAYEGFQESLKESNKLLIAVDKLIKNPSKEALESAKKTWVNSRIPYQQTEVYRFGNKIVDEWEGKVNAWPLDEGFIDYVDTSYGKSSDENAHYTANIINMDSIMIRGKKIDLKKIDEKVLSETLHELGEVETNVATGYHAIEFLLWGQDLNGTSKGSGNRPYTDYVTGKGCTNSNCDKRGQYLLASTKLLIKDLKTMVHAWDKKGQARKELLSSPKKALVALLTGMGSLGYGELAGERMKLGLILNDPEEEHDCFSDNTHNSHYYDLVGIRNVFFGTYKRLDGSWYKGVGLKTVLLENKQKKVAEELEKSLDQSLAFMEKLVYRAKNIEAYDQMLAAGNSAGNKTIQDVIDRLVIQTKSIENAAKALKIGGLNLEGSESLDGPTKAVN